MTLFPTPDSPFLLKNPHSNLYLSVKGRGTHPETEVFCWTKNGQSDQMWLFDADNSVIWTKLDDFVLEYSKVKKHLVINPFNANSYNQKWRFEGENIVSVSNPAFVITVLDSSSASILEYNGQPSQQWVIENVNDCETKGSKKKVQEFVTRNMSLIEDLPPTCATQTTVKEKQPFLIQTALLNERALCVYGESKNEEDTLYLFKPQWTKKQLWYFDEDGFIRSLLNDFVFHGDDGNSVLKMVPYNRNPRHQWRLEGTKILNQLNECLDIRGGKSRNEAQLCTSQYRDCKSQHWKLKL